jgi:hypothetical protein
VIVLTSQYHAYGDSITFGSFLRYEDLTYPNLIARDHLLYLLRYALPSEQACDVPTRQIFPHQDGLTGEVAPLYTLLIGTNDADVKGKGSYEAISTCASRLPSHGWRCHRI